MKCAACTLFEGQYHSGVAILVNSLYKNGFRGDFYAGYRGDLPEWAGFRKEVLPGIVPERHTVEVAPDLRLHFLRLETDYHFTNYKPDFMLWLLDGPARDADSIYYFDPDVVISAPWSFFERWVECGVALCEDVNSPLSRNHPRRVAWRNYFSNIGITLSFKDPVYVNGGFTGLHVRNRDFLKTWKKVQEGMAPAVGGLSRSALTGGGELPEDARGPFAPFGKTDQDALNASVEAWSGEVSVISKEGMGFVPGLAVMPHALGQPKPWNGSILKLALMGRPPKLVVKEYWKHANGPLKAHSDKLIRRKNIALNIAAVLGRFYKR